MALDPETARLLGEFTATLKSHSERLDRQYGDFSRMMGDQQSQLHEMKHELRGVGQQNLVINERLSSHLTSDENNQKTVLSEIKSNRENTNEQLTDLKNHQSSAFDEYKKDLSKDINEIKATSNDSKTKLEELLTWRNKVFGGLAVIGVVIGFLGHDILSITKDIGSFISKLGGVGH